MCARSPGKGGAHSVCSLVRVAYLMGPRSWDTADVRRVPLADAVSSIIFVAVPTAYRAPRVAYRACAFTALVTYRACDVPRLSRAVLGWTQGTECGGVVTWKCYSMV